MPVPFPVKAETLMTPPDAAEVHLMAGGIAGAIAGDEEQLTGLQRLVIEAVTEAMTGFVMPARAVPRLSASQFARGMARRNEAFRTRMVHMMLLGALVRVPLPEEAVDRIGEYARELGVEDDMLRVAHRFARGSFGLALLDFQRSGYMEHWDPAQSRVLHTSGDLDDAWAQCVHDETLALEWEKLRDLPEGTLGRGVANFYEARGFVFPGRPGSAPPLLAQHDWVHVLANYGSTVECEIETFAFIARANDNPQAFALLAMVVSLFETGYLARGLGLFEYDRGHLSHEGMAVRLADAMRRGANLAAHNSPNCIDLLHVDWFEYAARPIEELRIELGVVPKADYAVEMGSVGPWQTGGISAFQDRAGREAAVAADREYDSHGASPA